MSHGIRCTSSADRSDSQTVVGLDFVHHKGAFKGGDRVQAATWKFIDSLQIFSLLANVADVKSLVIHPYTTTHSQMTPQELEEQHIIPSTVRLSIGTEHIDDIIADLAQALDRI